MNLAVTLTRIAVALATLSLTGAAWAEDAPKAGNGFGLSAPDSSLPASLALPAAGNVAEVAPTPEDAAPKKAASPKRSCTSASCSYRSLLGQLVITRDLELPGSETVAVRLLPTSSALAGSSRSTIVVRPRLQDSTYGFHLAARF